MGMGATGYTMARTKILNDKQVHRSHQRDCIPSNSTKHPYAQRGEERNAYERERKKERERDFILYRVYKGERAAKGGVVVTKN